MDKYWKHYVLRRSFPADAYDEIERGQSFKSNANIMEIETQDYQRFKYLFLDMFSHRRVMREKNNLSMKILYASRFRI